MAFIEFFGIRRHSAPKICTRHKILPRRPEIASRQAKMASRWIRKGLREAGDGPRGAGRLQEGLREVSRSELRTNMARITLPGPPRTLPNPNLQEVSKSELRTNIARKPPGPSRDPSPYASPTTCTCFNTQVEFAVGVAEQGHLFPAGVRPDSNIRTRTRDDIPLKLLVVPRIRAPVHVHTNTSANHVYPPYRRAA